MHEIFRMGTDTAAMCIFDVDRLKHRLDDDDDWWADPNEEIAEVNKGNVLIVGLPADGRYKIEVVDNIGPDFNFEAMAKIKVPSGRVFIGAGEDITAGNIEPSLAQPLISGKFIGLVPGNYEVRVAIHESNHVLVTFSATKEEAENALQDQLLLFSE